MKKFKNTYKGRSFKLVFCGLILLFLTNNLLAATIDWKGGTSTNWGTASNWSTGTLPGPGDAVQIGVVSFTNQPTLNSGGTTTIGSLTFGIMTANITLTVNSGFTLAVTGSIYQEPGTLFSSSTVTVTLAGAGAITCSSLQVGNNSTFQLIAYYYLQFVSTVSSLHIAGNVSVYSTNDDVLFIGIGYNNALFSLQGGTTVVDGVILTNNTSGGLLPTTTAQPAFRIDMPTGSAQTPVLQLTNTAAINTASVAGSINFYNNTGGTGTCTVNYINSTGTTQTVYTNTTAALSSSPETYQNIQLTGTGTQTSNGGSLTVENDFTSSSSAVYLNTNNPNVTVGDDLVNSSNLTQGSGSIAVTNIIQNNSNTFQMGTGAVTTSTLQNTGGTVAGQTSAGAGTITVSSAFQNSGGTFQCAYEAVYFNGSYQNTSTFTAGTGIVYFDGAGAQTLQDNSTSWSIFNTVYFENAGTKTMSGIGGFAVSATGELFMAGTATLAAGGFLTLISNATGSATVAAIPSGTSITGNVNVERYMTGQTSATYRGYRLLSSPVNLTSATASATGANYIGLSTINSTYTVAGTPYYGAFTAGSGSGFTIYNANPIIYFYNETVATNNSSFLLGKNLGVTAISTASSNNITLVNGTTYSMPVGNGYILYYVGSTNGRSSGCGCLAPDDATITNVGYLNQGTIPLNLWYAPGGSTLNSLKLSYTTGQPVTFYPGYNMVGNPYASTIDLNKVYTDNQTANFSSNFYELYNENPNQGYVVYSATGGTSSFHASEYIASGQGFFTVVTAANQTLTFKEDQKVYNNSLTPSSSPPLLLTAPQGALSKPNSLALQGAPDNVLSGLHLKMGPDSVIGAECGIYFGPWSDNYDINDAYDLGGIAPQVSLSSYTADGVPAAINKLGDYVPNGKRIKLYVKAVADGNYNLSLEDIANIDTSLFNVYLVDHKNQDSLDMVRYKTYIFTITNADTTTYGANRLVLAIDRKTMPTYALISFTAQKTGDGVLLTWKTYNEGDFTGFGIQKQDGTQYETLYNVQSNGAGIYTYTDHSPAAGTNTYRLLQNNIDSLTSYSNPVSIFYNAAAAMGLLSVYPNPARGTINVNMNIAATAAVSYQETIYNSSGKLVVQRAVNNTSWAQDVSALTPGAYVIQIKTSNGSSVGNSKFVKMQ